MLTLPIYIIPLKESQLFYFDAILLTMKIILSIAKVIVVVAFFLGLTVFVLSYITEPDSAGWALMFIMMFSFPASAVVAINFFIRTKERATVPMTVLEWIVGILAIAPVLVIILSLLLNFVGVAVLAILTVLPS
jgi:hypothetical protein